jgi:hypothetical protein
MKYLYLFAAIYLCGTVVFADEKPASLFNLSLLWSGSWEESRTLHNRTEIGLDTPLGVNLRAQVLDRRTMNFKLDEPWGDPERVITQFTGGLYHQSTDSRLLVGVLDEYGLPARIRNPWIRSPPYAENHNPVKADLKTAASSTKNDEVYLYLSSPFVYLLPDVLCRGFVSVQTELESLVPAFTGGLDMLFPKNSGLLLEGFYTSAVLPMTRSSTWFSDPPRLPERLFNLSAAGVLFYNQFLLVSSDFAWSDTFAWGSDVYGNFGITFLPLIPVGRRTRPLSVSFAMDGSGERFVYRDGAARGECFRTAGKVEWRGVRNSLFRVNTVLRGNGFGEDFSRSSSGIFLRFPAANNDSPPVRLTRISLAASRNADNTQKINDGFSGNLGISIKIPEMPGNTSLGVNFSGSVRAITSSAGVPSPYPVPDEPWVFDSAAASCELSLPVRNFLFRSKIGYSSYANKDDKWDVSFSTAMRFENGRVNIKVSSSDYPKDWNCTISWRIEKK